MREDLACGITQEFPLGRKRMLTEKERQLLYEFIHYCYDSDLELMNKKRAYTTVYE